MQHGTAQGHMDHGMHVDLESIQSWVEKVVENGRVAEVCLTAATLTILGWGTVAFHKALLSYQIMGFSPF